MSDLGSEFVFCVCVCSISRLFSDAKKILLYSQNDRSLEGFKDLTQALRVLQANTSGENPGCSPGATENPPFTIRFMNLAKRFLSKVDSA